MRKFLTFAALALSSGAAVISAAGAAQATEHGTTWCAAPSHAESVEAACLSNHDSIHVGMWDTDVKSDWCVGAFAAFAPFFTSSSSPAMACDSHAMPMTEHPPVPGPPPVGNPCPTACPPVMPPPPVTPPHPYPHPHPHPCPPPPPPVMTPPPPCPPVMPPPPVMTPPPCPPQPCPPVMTPPPVPQPCPPGEDHHWTGSPESGPANTMGGLPIVGSALGGLL
ncbi:MAG: hypothetical protein HOW97_09415 [Catenulispora sp.]|nr:hypothetical protein [Catenulispora sp.]